MPPEVHTTNKGWNLQLQKRLSGIRLLLAMQNLCAELIISRYRPQVNMGKWLTKWDSHLQNGKFVYKTRLSFSKCKFSLYKRDSGLTLHPPVTYTFICRLSSILHFVKYILLLLIYNLQKKLGKRLTHSTLSEL